MHVLYLLLGYFLQLKVFAYTKLCVQSWKLYSAGSCYMHINKKSNFRRDVNYMAIIVMGTIFLLIADNYTYDALFSK